MKGTTNSAKIFLESGTGKVCRPPPPRRLEMAIMLSMESMRQYCLMLSMESMRQYCLDKKSPSRQKQPGETISQQLWPRYWQRPGSSALRIWLSRINRHHSDRLAGPLTPFRRRDKPGSRCPVIQFECIIAQDMTYCNGENLRHSPRLDISRCISYIVLRRKPDLAVFR